MKNLFFFLTGILFVYSCNMPQTERVILIGIDALSTDGLQSARTPNLNRLIRDGALSLKARGVMPTVSAPNWGSMLLGAGPEQHGITNNGWTTENYTVEATTKDADGYFPSIFTLLKEQRPELKSAMFYDWKELMDLYNEKNIDRAEYLKDYEAVYSNAVKYIGREMPDFTFIYAGHVDEIGHEFQHGSDKYYKSIEEIDEKVGDLLNVLDSLNIYETTHIIIISDHGGVGYGHGGESMAEIQIPWIIKGPGIIKNTMIEEPVNTFNTAPTIAYLFNLKQHTHWIGKPVFSAFDDYADPQSEANSYIPKPRSSVKSGIHTNTQTLTFSTDFDNASIFFTSDGSTPDEKSEEFVNSINLDSSQIIRAVTVYNGNKSEETEINFKKVLKVESAKLLAKPSPKYPAENNGISLIDGIVGNDDYTNSAWIGFESNDLEAIIDLGTPTDINKISLSCLENKHSWIFLPVGLVFYGSNNGWSFTKIGSINKEEIISPAKRNKVIIEKRFKNISFRYIKIVAENIEICPPDHAGAGGKAWLFVDEVMVE